MPNASRTYVSRDSVIAADGLVDGNGGRVIAWADNATEFYGSASVRGGANAGNGGFVEVSGEENLVFDGTVDVSAENGSFGSLLLDPTNIIIVDGADGDGTDDGQLDDGQILSDDGGTADFTISRGKLESLTGNIILEATNDITIADGVSLNFVPGGSITFTADAEVSDGVGAFLMDQTQSITAPGRNLTISGASITAGDIVGRSVVLDSTTGDITTGKIEVTTYSQGERSVHLFALGDIRTKDISARDSSFLLQPQDFYFVNLTSDTGKITVGNIYITGMGASLSLEAGEGDIEVSTINNLAPSGRVDIVAGGIFRATGTFGRSGPAGIELPYTALPAVMGYS